MSGTSSYIILEKEDGVYSVRLNYDSHYALFYLYLIHNKREDWEYIIDQGNASFIGHSLKYNKKEAPFENHYSDFYIKDYGCDPEDDKACKFKNFEDFSENVYLDSFMFYMDKNDTIYVCSDYYNDEEDEYDPNFKPKKKDYLEISEFIEKYISKERLHSIKQMIKRKGFRSHTQIIECSSKEEQEREYQLVKDELIQKNQINSRVFKSETNFDVFIVYKINSPYYDKVYL